MAALKNRTASKHTHTGWVIGDRTPSEARFITPGDASSTLHDATSDTDKMNFIMVRTQNSKAAT